VADAGQCMKNRRRKRWLVEEQTGVGWWNSEKNVRRSLKLADDSSLEPA
jgi:hypothetical protein